jgi:hypothetical protein
MSSSSNMSDPPMEEESIVRDFESEPVSRDAEAGFKSDRPATPDLTSDETMPESRPEENNATINIESQTATEATIEASTDSQTQPTAPIDATNTQQTTQSSQGASQPRTSWISNRRSASFVRHSEDYAPEVITFPNAPTKPAESPKLVQPTTTTSTRPLKRAHSFVRLRTNEDGTARINRSGQDSFPSTPEDKSGRVLSRSGWFTAKLQCGRLERSISGCRAWGTQP